jgi:hydrogenase maturation protein HypF
MGPGRTELPQGAPREHHATVERRRYAVTGVVQGVGFRPFVHRLAAKEGVDGWIRNDVRGVEILLEGTPEQNDRVIAALRANAPPLAQIAEVKLLETEIGPALHTGFRIASSDRGGLPDVIVTPDAFVCDDCLRELFDSSDRRYRYPFINCTNCGPRFSIVREVPYDRENTTMASFVMCVDCAREYGDISDRRFHAQPNACWKCGPQVRLLTRDGSEVPAPDPIAECARLMDAGAIVAIKGIGGYHVMCSPMRSAALETLRKRKRRPHKPFALLSERVEDVRRYAAVSEDEAALLNSTARPIVLLRRLPEAAAFSDLIAPGSGEYGVMLAYTPLHYLLLRGKFDALVATSANITNEPIVHRDEDLPGQLGAVVDYFLTHDRQIHTRVDDSIVRSVEIDNDRRLTSYIRRARGLTPKPIAVSVPADAPCVLAVGGELKNTISVLKNGQLVVSQHVGNLGNVKNYSFFLELCDWFPRMLGVRPEVVACDLHPDFVNSRFARALPGMQVVNVQHHHAHLAACAGEHRLREPVIGVTFDGMGYGADGRAWGGEFLLGGYDQAARVGHFRYFCLPGGDRAVKEPFRIAAALLIDALGPGALEDLPLPTLTRLEPHQRRVLRSMIERGINSPQTSSVGRLFDAAAALLDVRDSTSYDGQAAAELEQLMGGRTLEATPFAFAVEATPAGWEVDIRPTVRELVQAILTKKQPRNVLAARFHATIAEIVAEVCGRVSRETGVRTVVLSGGVFLNRDLLVRCHKLLRRDGLRVLAHRDVPTNDGGLAFGQALVAAARFQRGSTS